MIHDILGLAKSCTHEGILGNAVGVLSKIAVYDFARLAIIEGEGLQTLLLLSEHFPRNQGVLANIAAVLANIAQSARSRHHLVRKHHAPLHLRARVARAARHAA